MIAGDRYGKDSRRYVIMDRQDADRVGPVLSAGGENARGSAALLRLAISDRGNRQFLLWHSNRGECATMGRADAGRLRFQHQGVSALHPPPDPRREPVQRNTAVAR